MDSINICTGGNANEHGARHVKLTDHFLQAMRDRMSKSDRLAFLDALANGLFDRAVEKVRGDTRAAVCVGQSFVVFKLDRYDHQIIAFMTVLGPDEAESIGRRRDTTVVRLGG